MLLLLEVAIGSMSALSVGLVLLTAHTAPTNAWSGITRFSKAKGGSTHTGETPPREKRDDSTPAKQKPWSKWFSAKATADETPKRDAKAATADSVETHMAVWANGVFSPVSFLSRKHTTPKTPEPPIAAPKGVLRSALDHAKTFNTWVYNQRSYVALACAITMLMLLCYLTASHIADAEAAVVRPTEAVLAELAAAEQAAEAAAGADLVDAALAEDAAIEAAAAAAAVEIAVVGAVAAEPAAANADTAAITTNQTGEVQHAQDISSSSQQACAIVSSQVATAAVNIMMQHLYLPRELWCVSKAVHSTVKQSIPVKVNVSAGITAAIMQSLLSRSTVQHFNGRNLSADVLAALAAAVTPRRAAGSRSGFTLFGSCVHTVTLENFEQWSTRTVDLLFRTLPATVRTVTLALEQTEPQSDEVKRKCGRPLWRANAAREEPAAVHRRAAADTDSAPPPGALAPELPHGVTHVDLSESDIIDQYSFPDIPDTVTKLQLPAEYTHHIGNLPTQLEYSDVGYKYNKALGVLPATLKQLYIKRKADDAQQYEHALDELPYGLEVLHVANMTHSVGVLPNTVERLHCTNHSHELGILPASLKVLKIEGSNFNHLLGVLPDGLVQLDLTYQHQHCWLHSAKAAAALTAVLALAPRCSIRVSTTVYTIQRCGTVYEVSAVAAYSYCQHSSSFSCEGLQLRSNW
eukprot:17454-Heterococcus_DN1.PRE.1